MDCSPPGSSVLEISHQEYWSGLPFLSPRDLLYPGIEPKPPALAGRFFTTEPPGTTVPLVLSLGSITWTSYFHASLDILPMFLFYFRKKKKKQHFENYSFLSHSLLVQEENHRILTENTFLKELSWFCVIYCICRYPTFPCFSLFLLDQSLSDMNKVSGDFTCFLLAQTPTKRPEK